MVVADYRGVDLTEFDAFKPKEEDIIYEGEGGEGSEEGGEGQGVISAYGSWIAGVGVVLVSGLVWYLKYKQ